MNQNKLSASEILKKHEDSNEMHLHDVDRKWVIEAIEEYAQQSQSYPSKLVKSLQDVMESENENEPLSFEIIDMQRQAQQALESYKDGWVSVEEVAQWVIDNRYPKSELDKLSDHELYHGLIDRIKSLPTPPQTNKP